MAKSEATVESEVTAGAESEVTAMPEEVVPGAEAAPEGETPPGARRLRRAG